uniref:Uncharacterized protein n=1 Tax=Crocodylus porosus TaxID=8502 RepID=A0A7M4EHK7_CROPO
MLPSVLELPILWLPKLLWHFRSWQSHSMPPPPYTALRGTWPASPAQWCCSLCTRILQRKTLGHGCGPRCVHPESSRKGSCACRSTQASQGLEQTTVSHTPASSINACSPSEQAGSRTGQSLPPRLEGPRACGVHFFPLNHLSDSWPQHPFHLQLDPLQFWSQKSPANIRATRAPFRCDLKV